MLAAVLLRRDIASLARTEQMTGLSSSAAVALMGEIAKPLMSLFAQDGENNQQSRRQVGHCVAELCGSLSVSSSEHGKEWMKGLLGRLEPGVSSPVTCNYSHTVK